MSTYKSLLLCCGTISLYGMLQKPFSANLLKILWSSAQSYELPVITHPLFDQKIAKDPTTSLHFDETGRFLRYIFYKDSHKHVFIFNTQTGKTEHHARFVPDFLVQALTFEFDYSSDPILLIWNYLEKESTFVTNQALYRGNQFMSFYPGKNGIIAGSYGEFLSKDNVYEMSDVLVLYESDTFNVLKIIPLEDKKISRLRSSVCLSPDNTIVAALLHDGSIWLTHVKKPVLESVGSFYDVIVKCIQ